jgi:arsenite methyltransferase
VNAAEAAAEDLRAAVRARYAAHALAAAPGAPSGGPDPITAGIYDPDSAAAVPAAALAAAAGCGNPVALADLRPGETVLDLGSGGGIDVLLSAKRVGPGGFVHGLDMTEEMLALAERNRVAAGAENVRFHRGTLEAIPLPDASVDVIVSNCVINLAADKGRVLREAFRVLRPGGRFAVADVLLQGDPPPGFRKDLESWTGCIAGALEEGEYLRLLGEAGFRDASVEVTRVHDPAELGASAGGCCGGGGGCGAGGGSVAAAPAAPVATAGRIVSAFVRARKP